MKKFISISLAFAFSMTLLNCASQPKTEFLTDQQWKEIGGREIAANYEDVFEAVILTMQRNGYSVVNQNKKTGVILTDFKSMGTTASGITTGTSQISTTRMNTFSVGQLYEAKVVKKSAKSTEIFLRPSVFVNGQNRSSSPIWIIDGPNGQKTVLSALLNQIQSASVQ